MDQGAVVIKAEVGLSDVEFSTEGICVWSPQPEKDSVRIATEVIDDEKGRGMAFKVKRWRWIVTARTEDQKDVTQ